MTTSCKTKEIMDTESQSIKRFKVAKMWGRINLEWESINSDVNILVGINGCGKTTLLNLMYEYYKGNKIKKNIAESVEGNPITTPVTFIRSFDIPANGKKKTESMLLQDLKNTVNQNGEGTSFFDYRMKMLNYPEKAAEINSRIEYFFKTVNTFFRETGKEITIDKENNTLAFSLKWKRGVLRDSEGNPLITTGSEVLSVQDDLIQMDQLSSGEKQILLILTTVFLQEEKPHILMMDEPEISLHIAWQDRLIETLRELNPNCQIILTTHSPNIFTNGWEDKITFIEDLEDN